MYVRFWTCLPIAVLSVCLIVLAAVAWAEGEPPGEQLAPVVQTTPRSEAPTPAPAPPRKLTLVRAAMCEKVEHQGPINESLVFSAASGRVVCFTAFDPVPKDALIYHRWFHMDELSIQFALRISPPRAATHSMIQLRDSDKGPWRVEITDGNGKTFDILRFSIAD